MGLSWTHLPTLIWDVINERSLGRLKYVVFLSDDQQHTEISTPKTMSTSTITKVSTSLTPTVESRFQCQFVSIPLDFRCDGVTHCVPDGTDEQDCPEAPTISSPTSVPSIEASAITNDGELRVEFKNKKEAWKSKHNIYILTVIDKFTQLKLSILDCGKSKSVREAETVNFVVGTDEDIDKVGVKH